MEVAPFDHCTDVVFQSHSTIQMESKVTDGRGEGDNSITYRYGIEVWTLVLGSTQDSLRLALIQFQHVC